MTQEPGEVWEKFAVALADMARDLLAQDSVQATLDRIVEHATVLINGCDEGGILTVRRGEVRALAATNDVVRMADRIQQDLREGPCFDAVTEREQLYAIEDLGRPHEKWSRFAPELKAGHGQHDGLPALHRRGRTRRSQSVLAPSEHVRRVGPARRLRVLASHAAVALSSARTHQQLGHALETRHEIGEAMGILMERHGLSEEDAFAVLKKASQDHNIKLREIARKVCETGERPR